MAEPPHPVLAVGKVRHVGDPVAVVIAETKQAAKDAAELLEIDYAGSARGGDDAGRAEVRRARWCTTMRRAICATTGISATRTLVDGVFAKAAKVVKLDLTNNRLVPNAMEPRAAIGECDPSQRRLHAVHHQPEPARHPAADGRLRAAHSGEQAARRRARCRRRLRFEDLPLRRGGDRHLGVRQAAPPGEVDRRAQRKLHVGRAWPRPCHHRRDGAGCRRQFPGAAGFDAGEHGRLSVHLRAVHSHLSVRDVARRRLQDCR